MRILNLRGAALATTMLCSGLAHAQSIPVPPTRELIDGNWVDLFRGNYTIDETIASIGGSQGLTYRKINRGSGWTDNIEAFIQSGASTFYVRITVTVH